MQMNAAQHLGVGTAYKTDGVTQVPTRGVSMIMSSDTGGVPYGAIMPQLTTLQITPQSVSSSCVNDKKNVNFFLDLFKVNFILFFLFFLFRLIFCSVSKKNTIHHVYIST